MKKDSWNWKKSIIQDNDKKVKLYARNSNLRVSRWPDLITATQRQNLYIFQIVTNCMYTGGCYFSGITEIQFHQVVATNY